MLAVSLTVISVESVQRALVFDTKIAYADPSFTYVYGSDGNEHLAVNNFYPRTHTFSNPSDWNGSFGLTYAQILAQLSMSKKALNECRIIETHCEEYENNLCPLSMTGVAVIKPSGEVVPVWNNPF